jgi:hypothetical protein
MHPYHLSSLYSLQLCVASLKANNKQEKLAQGLVYGSLNYSWQLQDHPDGKKDRRMKRTEKLRSIGAGMKSVAALQQNEIHRVVTTNLIAHIRCGSILF